MLRRNFLAVSFSSSARCSSLLLAEQLTSHRMCSYQDLDGTHKSTHTKYRPQFRPRKLVLPIDLEDLHHSRRQGNMESYLEETKELQERVASYSAVKLGTIPEDKNFAELFAAVLERVKEKKLIDGSSNNNNVKKNDYENVDPTAVVTKDKITSFELVKREQQQEQAASLTASSSSSAALTATSYAIFDALECVPVNAALGGGLGALSIAGHSLLELEAASFISHRYPRLRSTHVNSLVHSVTGIQPMLRLATEIGFAHLCKMETETGLWAELSNLAQREQHVLRMLKIERQRQQLGVEARHTWFYEKELRGVKSALRHFPVDASTLLPRVEWVRNGVFAFIGWLEVSEGEAAAKQYIERAVCSLFEADAKNNDEEAEVEEDPEQHPLNKKQQRRARREASTAHYHGAEPFDDPFDRYSSESLTSLAPRRVVQAVDPSNALKEAQFILNYSPFVPRDELELVSEMTSLSAKEDDSTKTVKFDVEITTRNTAILDTDSFNLGDSDSHLHPEQRQTPFTPRTLEAEFVVWRRKQRTVLGRGVGVSEQDAVQAASLDFVRRYYLSPNATRKRE